MTRFRWGAVSDTGQVRSDNEDSSLVAPDRDLFVVADGMGGHQGGGVASSLAVTALREHYADRTTEALVEGVKLANRVVHDRAIDDPELRGMGTTLCAVALVESDGEELLAVVNVGDSRVYRLQGDELLQVSEDHSLVEQMVREGRLTHAEAASHPQRNIVTRALGIETALDVDWWEVLPTAGDRWLLCSDGLFGEVDDDRIASVLRRLDDPEDAARELVRLANDGGGRDNITVLVLDVVDDGDRAANASKALVGAGAAAGVGRPEPDVAGFGDAEPTTTNPVVGGADDDAEAPEAHGRRRRGRRHDGGAAQEPRSRRFTWRVALFSLLVLATLGAAAGAVGWYARNTYYVALNDDEVTIFQGRPDGVLWFDPTVAERTGIPSDDVPEAVVGDLEAGRDQATLEDAQRYVSNLEDQIEELEPEPTTTTTAPGPPPPTTAPTTPVTPTP